VVVDAVDRLEVGDARLADGERAHEAKLGAPLFRARFALESWTMPRSSVPASSEPMTRGTILNSLPAAVRDVWGYEGLRDVIARLPEETRAATTGGGYDALSWYPSRYALDWDVAKMEGPARGDEEAFRRSVDRGIDLGFGRVRRAFLSFATPILLANRAAELWRHDHTHGVLAVDSSTREEGRSRITLVGHPFVATALSRLAFAEVLRYVLSLSRARNVRESHAMNGEALVVGLTWDV